MNDATGNGNTVISSIQLTGAKILDFPRSRIVRFNPPMSVEVISSVRRKYVDTIVHSVLESIVRTFLNAGINIRTPAAAEILAMGLEMVRAAAYKADGHMHVLQGMREFIMTELNRRLVVINNQGQEKKEDEGKS